MKLNKSNQCGRSATNYKKKIYDSDTDDDKVLSKRGKKKFKKENDTVENERHKSDKLSPDEKTARTLKKAIPALIY